MQGNIQFTRVFGFLTDAFFLDLIYFAVLVKIVSKCEKIEFFAIN